VIDSPLLGLLLIGALLATPMLLRRARAKAPDGLRVVGRTALHKGAVVAVVAVGERRLLLGAGEKGVQLLTELDDDLTVGPDAHTDPDAGLAAPTSPDPHRLDRRTDAAVTSTWTDLDPIAALESRVGVPGASNTTAGPRIGLVDRLRAMTVRVSQPPHPGGAGRPSRVLLRR
jgi:hypothetical protein